MDGMNDHSARAHALLSASSAHRWLNCPASAVASELYANEGNEFTREGTLAHEIAEGVVSGKISRREGPGAFIPEVTQEMLDCAAEYEDFICELIKGPNAIRLLEQRVDFSPWVPEGFGTCDCILIQDKILTIIDYKYGVGVPVSAKNNPQMMLYALGALNDYGIALDVDTVEMYIFQPRINNISSDSCSVNDLMAWAESTVKPTAEKAVKGKGGYKAGSWCKFCPHAGKCRTLSKTCTEYVSTHGMRASVPVLAPHELAEVLQMEPLVALWLKRVKAQALTDMIDGKEVPGWKVVEGKLGNRKWTDELQVAQTLEAAGYGPGEYTETKLLSPAAMEKALGKKKAAELLEGMISRDPGAPTIAPAEDKRPAYNKLEQAQKDYE